MQVSMGIECRHQVLCLSLQVLVQGVSKRDAGSLTGRTDTMKRVVFPDAPMAAAYGSSRDVAATTSVHAQPGDYVAVEVRTSHRL